MSYKIVRVFQKTSRKYTLQTGLSLEEALAACLDPEGSWQTCTKKSGRARTRRHGPWMDVYYKE